ncbi:MAG TPA: DNA-binding protein [Candidatus Saccharimonadales bacterium]|nr:DNA-binding protein [Candidatus Saccharimonadales bacterium]
MPERKAFLLRISPDLWESLEQWAADELRSVNGQIEFMLAQAVREAGRDKRRRARRDRETPP